MHYDNNSHRFGNCEVSGKFHRRLLRGKHRNFGITSPLAYRGEGVLRQTTCMSYFFRVRFNNLKVQSCHFDHFDRNENSG